MRSLAFWGLFGLLAFFIVALPEDGSGTAFAWVLCFLPLASKKVRKNHRILFPLILALCFRQIGTFVNIFIVNIPGAFEDAARFHNTAAGVAGFENEWKLRGGTGILVLFLWGIYNLFQPSMVLGQQTSIFAFFLSIIVFLQLRNRLKAYGSGLFLLPLYTFLPTMVFWGSAILREPWQILTTLCATLLALGSIPFPLKLFLLIFPLGLLSKLHSALIAYSLAFLFLVALFHFRVDKFFFRTRLRVLCLLLILSLGSLVVLPKVILAVQIYRTGAYLDAVANKGRSLYGVTIQTDSPLVALLKFPLIFIGYFFFPMPWQVRRIVDIYAMLEGFLRFLLMYFGFKAFWKARGEQKRRLGFVWLAFLGMEALWAVGTVSWFTAMRHHMPAYGLLVLLGGPGLGRALHKMLRVLGRATSRRLVASEIE